jgi:diacylglycerol kinase family enzyme
MQIGVITNPRSRKNRGRPNRAAELQRIVGDHGEVHATHQVDDIKPILRDFLRRRARYWVADGGDGALHWMVRAGLELLQEDEFAASGTPLPLTVPTNGGTIDYVAHNVGIVGRAEEILATLRGAIESGQEIEEVEVDSMLIEGIEVTERGDEPFRTYGFGSAVAGIGQRFYDKYYAHQDPNPKTILKVVGTTIASMPIALSPLRTIPGIPKDLRHYARDMFRPAAAKVTMDGMVLPHNRYSGIHIASMSINQGGVFRLFSQADQPGIMHALVGATSPLGIVAQLPRMHLGKQLRGKNLVDRACRELVVEAAGDELLAPIIDGEYYRDLKRVSFRIGPRLRIPKVVGQKKSAVRSLRAA